MAIPWLELQAAVLASRLKRTFLSELKIEVIQVPYRMIHPQF